MAGKKDFSKLNTGRVYDAIAEATAEPEAQEAQEVRETYETSETHGRKGCKLPRINMAFGPEEYAYIRTMAAVRGENMTQFLNYVIRESMKEHADLYERAKEFKSEF